jgi:amino acid adenylation domain-containing protein
MYRDVSERIFAASHYDREREYWINKLSGDLVKTRFSSDGVTSGTEDQKVGTMEFQFSPQLYERLMQIINNSDSNLHIALVMALTLLLYKYTGNKDIIIGAPIEKQDEDYEFINTILPLRNQIEEQSSVKEFLMQVNQTVIEAVENQNFPIETIPYELGIPVVKDEFPLFDTAVLLQNIHDRKYLQHINLNIIFSFSRTENSLEGTVEYNASIFQGETIQQIVNHLLYLMQEAFLHVDLKLIDVPVLTAEEKKRMVVDFNNTAVDYPRGKMIHQLFEDQVEKSPENIAVESKDKRLTYKELNEKANQLARLLRKKGVGSGTTVSILLETSIDVPVAILAVLKAGGTYLPIGFEFPEERVNYMLNDSKTKILLSRKSLVEGKSFQCPIIDLDEEAVYAGNSKNLAPITEVRSLAYIIYTSGTTGQPKGVMIEHQGLVNYICWASRKYVNKDQLNFALFTSISFDLTVTSIFTPLITGNTIIVHGGIDKNLYIEEVIEDSRVGIVKLTPSHLKLIRGKKVKNTSIKRLIVGGEDLKNDLARDIYNNFDRKVEIFNEYGPTETVVGSMIYQFNPGYDQRLSVPIGVPIANTQVYLLNKYSQPIPAGVVGELYVGGDGVARGYLHNPGMTTEKFIPNPFVPGKLIYKTGDLAVLLPDGNIQYKGRADNQLKIWGHRVETGEIESKIIDFQRMAHARREQEENIVEKLDLKSAKYCKTCVLPENYPGGINIDEQGVCEVCREFESYKDKALKYYKTMDDFHKLVERMRKKKKSKYDCLLLYSGGKDSSYVLHQLVDMGLSVLTFTFDNGYISEKAFENIERMKSLLNVDHIVLNLEKMKEIFVESLWSDYNVCNGCFKAVNTFGAKLAHEHNINLVISGLTRGQIFEIKLHGLFKLGIHNEEDIEARLKLFRKNYHSMSHRTSRLIGEEITEKMLENIYFADFFRYTDVSQSEILEYLKGKDDTWARPTDTGASSSNCIINDVGIYVHLKDKGCHFYSSQIGWDVRLGICTREEGLDEIFGYKVDYPLTQRVLNEIGYYNAFTGSVVTDVEDGRGDNVLAAYIVADRELSISELKAHLSRELPSYMVPTYFTKIDSIPLTAAGKVNLKKLPRPVLTFEEEYVAPRNEIEEKLTWIWVEVLGLKKEKISINANFFDVGGHSLRATFLAASIQKHFNVRLPLVKIFEAPTIRTLAEVIKNAAQEIFISIHCAEKKEYYVMSSAQRRLKFLQQLDLNAIAYNTPLLVEMEGKIEKKKVKDTFKKLCEKHESFRTSFIMVENMPVQRINQVLEFDIGYYVDSRMEIENIVKDFVRPFDLLTPPLLRVGLIKINPLKHILMVDMHHIITDGISYNVLLNDFMTQYNDIQPAGLRLQYKDYSEWQQCESFKESIKKQEEFWLKEFEGEIPVLNMLTDYSRPQVQSFEGDRIRFEIGEDETTALNEIARLGNATLFMVLLSTYNIFLSKISGQENIVVGTPVAGRRHADLENIAGMFVNTLALNTYPSGEKTIKQFLNEIKDVTMNAFENQDYHFEDLVEKIVVQRDSGRNPIFDITFVLQNQFDPAANMLEKEIPGLKLIPYDYENKTSKFDLTLVGVEAEKKLLFSFEYSTKLFKRETIERFITYFLHIAQEVVENSRKKISDIEIITEEEKKRILYDFNDTETDYPKDKTIHRLFEERVKSTPDRIALHGRMITRMNGEEGSITYKELNKQSNRLAYMLLEKGIQPDTIVGIMIERSVEMIIGILGILKSGGAYLPIDQENPVQRILAMLEDCQVPVLLTETGSLANHSFSELQGYRLLSRGRLLVTAKRPQITNLDELPFAHRWAVDYEKYNKYIGQGSVKNSISVQATRGCPYNCLYCHKIWPKRHVYRSAENIFQEVQLYYNMGVRRFVFVDDIFNLNIQNSRRFFQLIIEHGLKVQMFFPNGVRGDILTREYIDLMVKAGVTGLALALETASPRLQKLIHKNLDLERLRENIQYLCEKYPQVMLELFIMIGFPTETEEEALLTLDFVKSLKWIDFPYISILRIFPNTDMEKFAIENGISKEAIARSQNLAYHELPETLVFDKNFTKKYQSDFFNQYFLSKERLLKVLPHQMRAFTEDEMTQKYNSYLPTKIRCLDDLLQFVGINRDELDADDCLEEDWTWAPGLNGKMKAAFPLDNPDPDALRVLLLDVSQNFEGTHMLYDVVEPPLGLMHLLAYLKHTFGPRVNGKIAKPRIDFDNYPELHTIIKEFRPHLIGIRTLTFFRDNFHKTAAMLRHWGFDGPVITGGPYATSAWDTILQDRNIDLVVLGEGELTLAQIVKEMMDNNRALPGMNRLKEIKGIALRSDTGEKKATGPFCREIIMVDRLEKCPEEEFIGNPPYIGQPGNLSYVIYTSGSTGIPKGVLTTQTNVTRVVKNTNYIDIEPGDRILQLSNYAFDGSVFDIYGALLNGAELVMINKDEVLEIRRLLEVIKRKGITVFFVTTALFNTLVEMEIGCFDQVRKVLFGGERVSMEHSGKALDYLGKGRIIHVYGPTETTVYATYHFIDSIDAASGNIPIGKPISNTTAYILDKHLHPVLIGVTGELYIGGTGGARGYLNNPELTAEKFIEIYFDRSHRSYRTHNKLYKTGDLVRMLPDGSIEFLGRIDHQIKIRGFRVELGEIESQLMKHKEIKEAVVLAPTYENGDRYLCGYITAAREFLVSELKEYLVDRIPGYMIPSDFVLLEKMPLSKTGKVDRKQLNSLGKKLSTGVQHVAPKSDIQVVIAEIWKKVLKLDKVGIYDNFFDLGGTSIDMIHLNSELKEKFNRDITIVALYRYTTIDALSRFLDDDNRDVENSPASSRNRERAGKIKKGREDRNKRREIRIRRSK